MEKSNRKMTLRHLSVLSYWYWIQKPFPAMLLSSRNYLSLSYTNWECKYRIAWVPKFRRKVFCVKARMSLRHFYHRLPTNLEQWINGKLEIVWPKDVATARYVYPVPKWGQYLSSLIICAGRPLNLTFNWNFGFDICHSNSLYLHPWPLLGAL